MGNETRLFKAEERKNRSEVAQFLRQMADKIDAGEVVLRQGSQEQVLNLPDNLILEIQVEDEQKGNQVIQHSLEIEIKWFDDDQGGSFQLG